MLTSTLAGRSIRMSASTVFGVGSRMSISRLCVRISKCSRESLYLRVDRFVVVGLEPDEDLLSRHAKCPFLRFSFVIRKLASVPPSICTARTHEDVSQEITTGHARSSPLFICHGSPVHAVGRVAHPLIPLPRNRNSPQASEQCPGRTHAGTQRGTRLGTARLATRHNPKNRHDPVQGNPNSMPDAVDDFKSAPTTAALAAPSAGHAVDPGRAPAIVALPEQDIGTAPPPNLLTSKIWA
jgi:hypothetical protein